MRLVIVHHYAEPQRTLVRIGELRGGAVELHVENGVARVRVDDWTQHRAGRFLPRQLATMVERATGERVTALGPPVLS